ncbi:hypothetical protein CLJ1_4299 [Pseudomonas paraeruginosa]|nr:hypothetical protein CLJ1_4299 [Pseudomonas aeruginosa]
MSTCGPARRLRAPRMRLSAVHPFKKGVRHVQRTRAPGSRRPA